MENFIAEKTAACALNRIFGYEPRYALGFIRTLGSARAVFDLPASELERLTGPAWRYAGSISRQALDEAAEELERLERDGCRFVPITDKSYPEMLKACEDPPAGLYVRSSDPPEKIFSGKRAVAVVGTRDISPYGREWTARIVQHLARTPERPAIVSGLAFGVDIRAHLSALEYGLPTIAVLPVGIDDIYPARHREAAERIASTPGSALVTDYPPGTGAAAFTFLRRNRIIAGLSGATILVESRIKGGGLLTCRLACGYGRDVLVLPGRIDDVRSAGCNLLLAEKLAEPITDISLLGRQLGLGRITAGGVKTFDSCVSSYYSALADRTERDAIASLASLIRRHRGADTEELCTLSGKPRGEVLRLIGILESDGFITTDLLGRCTINPKNS